MRRLFWLAAFLAAAFWWFTRPQMTPPAAIPGHAPDAANGERMFLAGGCGSCHGSLSDGDPDPSRLGGGLAMMTPVGVFHAPNISPHPVDGIGAWSPAQFVDAMKHGVSPAGRHYYPAFPYPSYARMTVEDLLDLKAYLDGLEPVPGRAPAHQLDPPFAWRRPLGLWKRLFLDESPVVETPAGDEMLTRGRYLVEGPGHCGDCHTPRTWVMAPDHDRWLRGAPMPDGEGSAPDISNGPDGLEGWSAADIADYLETGVDPDFDIVGGEMVAVQENLARLPASDREAIAAYLKSVNRVDVTR